MFLVKMIGGPRSGNYLVPELCAHWFVPGTRKGFYAGYILREKNKKPIDEKDNVVPAKHRSRKKHSTIQATYKYNKINEKLVGDKEIQESNIHFQVFAKWLQETYGISHDDIKHAS